MKDIEVELKFQIMNSTNVITYLKNVAEFKYESFQHDVYYNPPHRDFLADKTNISEWLRVRIEKDGAQITYKDWQPRDNPIKTHCVELETIVGSYEQLSRILEALDFKQLVDVKKTRRAWEYLDTEISLDIVEDLGEYLEVEYKGSKLNDIKAIREHLHTVVREIGAKTGEPDLKGYPFGLLKKKRLI